MQWVIVLSSLITAVAALLNVQTDRWQALLRLLGKTIRLIATLPQKLSWRCLLFVPIVLHLGFTLHAWTLADEFIPAEFRQFALLLCIAMFAFTTLLMAAVIRMSR